MQKLEQLYEGKAKKVFKTDDPKALKMCIRDRPPEAYKIV